MLTAIIDGDPVAFLAAYGRKDVGRKAVDRVRNFQERTKADRVIVCAGCAREEVHRKSYFTAYKSGPGSPKPPGIGEAWSALRESFLVRELPGCEADDVCGILMTVPTIEGDRILIGVDKDFATIPGRRYNPATGMVFEQSARSSRYAHMMQTLTGDNGDGYPGVRGIGPAKAKKVLGGDESQWWINVCNCYEANGMTVVDAIAQARCARILHFADFDFKSKRVIPWTPPYGVLAEAVA